MRKLTGVFAIYPAAVLRGSFSGCKLALNDAWHAACYVHVGMMDISRSDISIGFLESQLQRAKQFCKCLPSPCYEGQMSVVGRSSPLYTPHLLSPCAHSSSASQVPPSYVCRPLPPSSAELAVAWALGTASQRRLFVGSELEASKRCKSLRTGSSNGSNQNDTL